MSDKVWERQQSFNTLSKHTTPQIHINPELFINGRTFHQLVSDFRAKVHHQGTTILLLLLESQVAIEVMKVWQECLFKIVSE